MEKMTSPRVCSYLGLVVGGFLLICVHNVITYKIHLNKNWATQSSKWRNHWAGLAADGNKSPVFAHHSCTHSLEEARPWWMVRLDKRYIVTGVNMYNRRHAYRRLQKLNIRVGNNSDLSEQSLCAYFNGTVASAGHAYVMCDEAVFGQYVSIQKTTRGAFDDAGQIWTNRSGFMTLCEVEVYGYEQCAEGYFGRGCNTSCNCLGTCSSDSGSCDGVCSPGWRGISCQTGRSLQPSAPSPIYVTSKSVLLKLRLLGHYEYRNRSKLLYTIQYSTDPAAKYWVDGPKEMDFLNHNVTEVLVTGLTYNTYYRFRVHTKYFFEGRSFPGMSSRESKPRKTNCEAPTRPVITTANATQDPYGRTTAICVKWQALPIYGHRCSSYDRLEILYSVQGHPPWTQLVTSHHNWMTVNIIFPQLGEYSVAVRVFNNDQISSTSETYVVRQGSRNIFASTLSSQLISSTTNQANLGIPSVFLVSNDSVLLKLKLQASISSFLIQYHMIDGSTGWQWTDGPTQTRESADPDTIAKVGGLSHNTEYIFRVIPYRLIGGRSQRGSPSPQTKPIKTKCQAPERPVIESGQASMDASSRVTAIHLQWKKLVMGGHNCNRYTKVVILVFNVMDPLTQIIVTSTSHSLTCPVTFPRKSEYLVAVRVYNDENIYSTSATWLLPSKTKGSPVTTGKSIWVSMRASVTRTPSILVTMVPNEDTFSRAGETHSNVTVAGFSDKSYVRTKHIVLGCLAAGTCFLVVGVLVVVAAKFIRNRSSGYINFSSPRRLLKSKKRKDDWEDIILNHPDTSGSVCSHDNNSDAATPENSKSKVLSANGEPAHDRNIYHVDVA